jgi:hypothetical protein
MPALRSRKFLLAATLGIALVILVRPGVGFAYTQEEQQACTPDAMRLCGEFVPNVDAITACMIQKKAQLSPQCRPFFRQGPEPDEVAAAPRASRPTSIKPHSAKKSTKPSSKASKKKKSEES